MECEITGVLTYILEFELLSSSSISIASPSKTNEGNLSTTKGGLRKIVPTAWMWAPQQCHKYAYF